MPRPAPQPAPSDEGERYSAPALDKGLDILELLSLEREPLTMSQIAERLSRSKSELFRMLVALERRDYIRRDEATERFSISNRLFELAMRTPPTRNLVATALPHLEAVAHDLEQSCHLAVLSGAQITVVARVESPGELGFAVRVGYHRRIDHSTSGRVIAAFSSARVLAQLVARLADDHSDFRSEAFEADIAAVRDRGHDASPSLTVKGVTDIGVPIFGENGFAVAAMTVPFIRRVNTSASLSEARLLLLRHAAAVSRELAIGAPGSDGEAPGWDPRGSSGGHP